MPRATLDKNYFSQTTGKITEASPLLYPQGSLVDSSNVEVDFTGVIKRRKGLSMDSLDVDPIDSSQDFDTLYCDSYLWEAPSKTNTEAILVVSFIVHNTSVVPDTYDLYVTFYDASKEDTAGNRYNQIIKLASQSGETTDLSLSITSAKGRLFIASNVQDTPDSSVPFSSYYIDFDPEKAVGSQFESHKIEFKVRDTIGALPNGFPRNDTINDEKRYDNINSGWPYDSVNYSSTVNGTSSGNDISWEAFKKATGLFSSGDPSSKNIYPSSADVFSSFKDDRGYIVSDFIKSNPEATGLSARGKYILPLWTDATQDDISTVYSANVLPLINTYSFKGSVGDASNAAPTCIEFFQGHLCYAGATCVKTSLRNAVLVSQSLTTVDKAGAIHSVNDPTKDISSSPLDTDGGVIRLDGVESILSIKVIGSYLIVFATNGVWVISGSLDSIFTVNNVNIGKISDEGIASPQSVVSYKGALYFWSTSGIYSISTSSGVGGPVVTDLTESTIQSDYNSITLLQKKYCKGAVDSLNRKIYWIYNTNYKKETDIIYNFNEMLILDLRSRGFYKYSISTSNEGPFIHSIYLSPYITQEVISEEVTVSSNSVTVLGEKVTINTPISSSGGENRLKVWGLYKESGDTKLNRGFTATFSNRNFIDWEDLSVGGDKDYLSFLESGYDNVGDTMRNKQMTYVFCYFNRTEKNFLDDGTGVLYFDYPSSCILTTKWNWTDSGAANKWSQPQQVYRFTRNYTPQFGPFDYSYDVIETKNKVRGRGKSLRMRFESESGKDFQLLGWAVNYTSGTKV